MKQKVIKEFEAYSETMKDEIIIKIKKNIFRRRLMKIMWIIIWLALLGMFYISASVCFMSEMQWLAWIYIIFFSCLMVKLGDRILKL